MSPHESAVEAREFVGMLQSSTPFGPLINVIQREPDCFFKHGGLNCAAAARHLGVPADNVRAMVQQLRGMTGA